MGCLLVPNTQFTEDLDTYAVFLQKEDMLALGPQPSGHASQSSLCKLLSLDPAHISSCSLVQHCIVCVVYCTVHLTQGTWGADGSMGKVTEEYWAHTQGFHRVQWTWRGDREWCMLVV